MLNFQKRLQYVGTCIFNPKHKYNHCCVFQTHCWFFIDINDLNSAIKYILLHHFVVYSHLISDNIIVKRMNKEINQELKILTHWLNATKIRINISKTEVELFKSRRKQEDVPLKLNLISSTLLLL